MAFNPFSFRYFSDTNFFRGKLLRHFRRATRGGIWGISPPEIFKTFTFAWGYCRLLFKHFCFYVQCLTVAGVSQPSSNVARETRNSQEPRSIRCYLGSPSKSGWAHPHLMASLDRPFVIKLKLHSCSGPTRGGSLRGPQESRGPMNLNVHNGNGQLCTKFLLL